MGFLGFGGGGAGEEHSLRQWLKERVEDVLNVEVNTLMAEGITASRMPPWPVAMGEVIQAYVDFLRRFGCVDRRLDGIDHRQPSDDAFAVLLELANAAAARGKGDADGGDFSTTVDSAVLRRIQRYSEDLQQVVTELLTESPAARPYIRVPGREEVRVADSRLPRLAQAQVTPLRKAWELKTHTVAVQTVFQFDGDMVNRVAVRSLPRDNQSVLFELHKNGLDRALGYWAMIFELFERVFARRP
jgi:hypothetical protein